ncbi:MAG TPA: S8 family serine peptidase [Chitinophagales bacterium]|nr:S8 family serine peptidase [Chitinophagales bacterium]
MDLCAPDRGYNICYHGDFFGLPGGGTSLATPIVSGVVALMRHINQCMTYDEIEDSFVPTSLSEGNVVV